jgi:hypothetical protein
VSAAGGFFFYHRRRFSIGLCGLVPDFSSLDLGAMDVAPPAPTPQRSAPLRDLYGEPAADVLDLGRRVPGLPRSCRLCFGRLVASPWRAISGYVRC